MRILIMPCAKFSQELITRLMVAFKLLLVRLFPSIVWTTVEIFLVEYQSEIASGTSGRKLHILLLDETLVSLFNFIALLIEILDIAQYMGASRPQPLGVFRYRLLSLNHLKIVHFY